MSIHSWRERIKHLPGVAPTFALEPARTALLLVDMQYACASRDHQIGAFYRATFPELGERYFDRVEQVVLPTQQRLLEQFRARGLRVIYLTIGSELPDGADLLPHGRNRDRVVGAAMGRPPAVWRHDPERQIMAEVAPRSDELVINKLSKGAFNSSNLDQVLRNLGIDSLVVGGVATHACVALTAQDAADRGYKTVIVEDACAAPEEVHENTLLNYALLYGPVLNADEVLEQLGGTVARERVAVAP
jgi:biuret amidohydrolase